MMSFMCNKPNNNIVLTFHYGRPNLNNALSLQTPDESEHDLTASSLLIRDGSSAAFFNEPPYHVNNNDATDLHIRSYGERS